MHFIKMHGASNDYVYIDGFKTNTEEIIPLIPLMSDRHRGIGSDGVVFIMPSDIADLRMRMFNSDGSEAQMCGNAIRCVGKYAYERGIVHAKSCTIETLGGIKTLFFELEENAVKTVSVNMGMADFNPKTIPVAVEADTCLEYPIDVFGTSYSVSCVSMGNPHAVVFVNDVENMDITKIGPYLENHELFPERVNVEFVQVLDKKRLRMRVWERGAGETEACGTGACAAAVISHTLGHTENDVELVLNGGSLQIEIKEDKNIFMTGDAHIVFEGEFYAN